MTHCAYTFHVGKRGKQMSIYEYKSKNELLEWADTELGDVDLRKFEDLETQTLSAELFQILKPSQITWKTLEAFGYDLVRMWGMSYAERRERFYNATPLDVRMIPSYFEWLAWYNELWEAQNKLEKKSFSRGHLYVKDIGIFKQRLTNIGVSQEELFQAFGVGWYELDLRTAYYNYGATVSGDFTKEKKNKIQISSTHKYPRPLIDEYYLGPGQHWKSPWVAFHELEGISFDSFIGELPYLPGKHLVKYEFQVENEHAEKEVIDLYAGVDIEDAVYEEIIPEPDPFEFEIEEGRVYMHTSIFDMVDLSEIEAIGYEPGDDAAYIDGMLKVKRSGLAINEAFRAVYDHVGEQAFVQMQERLGVEPVFKNPHKVEDMYAQSVNAYKARMRESMEVEVEPEEQDARYTKEQIEQREQDQQQALQLVQEKQARRETRLRVLEAKYEPLGHLGVREKRDARAYEKRLEESGALKPDITQQKIVSAHGSKYMTAYESSYNLGYTQKGACVMYVLYPYEEYTSCFMDAYDTQWNKESAASPALLTQENDPYTPLPSVFWYSGAPLGSDMCGIEEDGTPVYEMRGSLYRFWSQYQQGVSRILTTTYTVSQDAVPSAVFVKSTRRAQDFKDYIYEVLSTYLYYAWLCTYDHIEDERAWKQRATVVGALRVWARCQMLLKNDYTPRPPSNSGLKDREANLYEWGRFCEQYAHTYLTQYFTDLDEDKQDPLVYRPPGIVTLVPGTRSRAHERGETLDQMWRTQDHAPLYKLIETLLPKTWDAVAGLTNELHVAAHIHAYPYKKHTYQLHEHNRSKYMADIDKMCTTPKRVPEECAPLVEQNQDLACEFLALFVRTLKTRRCAVMLPDLYTGEQVEVSDAMRWYFEEDRRTGFVKNDDKSKIGTYAQAFFSTPKSKNPVLPDKVLRQGRFAGEFASSSEGFDQAELLWKRYKRSADRKDFFCVPHGWFAGFAELDEDTAFKLFELVTKRAQQSQGVWVQETDQILKDTKVHWDQKLVHTPVVGAITSWAVLSMAVITITAVELQSKGKTADALSIRRKILESETPLSRIIRRTGHTGLEDPATYIERMSRHWHNMIGYGVEACLVAWELEPGLGEILEKIASTEGAQKEAYRLRMPRIQELLEERLIAEAGGHADIRTINDILEDADQFFSVEHSDQYRLLVMPLMATLWNLFRHNRFPSHVHMLKHLESMGYKTAKQYQES